MYFVLIFSIIVPSLTGVTPQTIGVGPDGLTSDASHPYYLMVNLTQPEPPRDGTPADDCAGDQRPNRTIDGLGAVVDPLFASPPDPLTIGSVEPYFPRCVAIPIVVCSPASSVCSGDEAVLYASYDFSTGRYYVEASPSGILGMRPNDIIITGTSGTQVTADCVGCPPIKDGGGG